MAKKKSLNNNYIIKYSGSNPNNFINVCRDNGLTLNNIVKGRDGLQLGLTEKDYKIWKGLDMSFYPHELVSYGGRRKLLSWYLSRIGLIIGLCIGFVLMLLLNNRLLQVHVLGLENIDKSAVVEYLESQGVNKLSKINYDLSQLEDGLAREFDFSLVSIITKGNSLVVSVKESLPDISDTYAPITADYNMVIKSISVYSGTQMVESGDIAYKGDVLVEPYYQKGEDKVYVAPCADIIASVYFTESVEVLEKELVMQRTGEYSLVSVIVSLGSNEIYRADYDVIYSQYELQSVNCDVTSLLLPIKVSKVYAYQVEEVEVTKDIESSKQEVITRLKDDVYGQVPESVQVLDEEVGIVPIDSGYIVSVCLTTEMRFRYQLHD